MSDKNCRNALTGGRQHGPVRRESSVQVAVRIDKAGCQHQSCSINKIFARAGNQIANGRNLSLVYAHTCEETRRPGTVNNGGIVDQD